MRPLRLGLRQVRGLAEDEARRLVAARGAALSAKALPPSANGKGSVSLAKESTFERLVQAAKLSRRTIELLAEADAFRSLGLDRRGALWMVKGLETRDRSAEAPLLARMGRAAETQPQLPGLSLAEHVAEDYRTTALSLKAHPCRFFREPLAARRVRPTVDLRTIRDGTRVRTAGLVLIRQRPGTAKGVMFVTVEDETGVANLVVWRDRFEAERRVLMTARFLAVEGRVQREGEVIHLVGERFWDLTGWLGDLREGHRSRDFH